MTLMHFIFSATFLMGLAGLALHRIHLLSTLLCLESMMLSLFIAFSMWSIEFNSTNFSASPLLLLAFSACEASAGLALLVATTRTHGSDKLQNLSLLQC